MPSSELSNKHVIAYLLTPITDLQLLHHGNGKCGWQAR